jgi:hypothetical protein
MKRLFFVTFNGSLVEEDLLPKYDQVNSNTEEAANIDIEPIKVVLRSQEMRIASGTSRSNSSIP